MRDPPEWLSCIAVSALVLAVLIPSVQAGLEHGWKRGVVGFAVGCLALLLSAAVVVGLALAVDAIKRRLR